MSGVTVHSRHVPAGSSAFISGISRSSTTAVTMLWVFVLAPFVALLAAIPVAWGWGLSPLDATMAVVGYLVTVAGVAVGFHRHLTHGSFKATRSLRIALAVAGSLAVEGPPTEWVADHRRHHAFADREGDPHSPWRYGNGVRALRWPDPTRLAAKHMGRKPMLVG